MAMGIDLTGFAIRAASVVFEPTERPDEPNRLVLVHYAEAAKPRSGHYGAYENFIRDFIAIHREITGQQVIQVGLAWDDHHSGHGERSTVQGICEALSIRVLGFEQAATAAIRSDQCEFSPHVTAHWPRETFEESRPSIGVAVAAAYPAKSKRGAPAPSHAVDTTTPDDHYENEGDRSDAVSPADANPATETAPRTAGLEPDPQIAERLSAALAQVTQLETVSQALRGSVDQGLREASAREARIVELSERLDALQIAHAAELARAHSRRESMEAEVTTLRSSFQDQKAHALDAASGLEELQTEAEERRHELAAHEEALAQYDQELTDFRAAQNDLQAELESREETIASLRGELASHEQQLTDVRAELDHERCRPPTDEEIEAQNDRVAEAFDAGAALGERAARRVIELEAHLQRLTGIVAPSDSSVDSHS